MLDLPPASRAPWWLRIAAKLVLARLPVPYRWWRRLGVFRHGCLDTDVEQRGKWFMLHSANYRDIAPAPLRAIVELGPGDSVATALFARGFGAERVWLVDVGRFATDDPAHYRAALARVAALGGAPPVVPEPGGIDAVLAATDAAYLSDGIASLAAIADSSVDLIFSNAVLEHIRRDEFDRLLQESFRILRPGGVGSHLVDLGDHLGGGLNNLRFSHRVWEHPAMAGGGFYTNRLRHAEICRRAAACGFGVTVTELARWPAPPTPRRKLAAEFRGLSDDELAVAVFTVVMQKPAAAPA